MTRPLSKWEAEHLSRMDAYAKQIERLYRAVLVEVAASVSRAKPELGKVFSFEDYPSALFRVNLLLSTLASNVQVVIGHGTESAWNLANGKSDELISSVFADANLSEIRLAPFNQRNLDALASFQTRSVNGLTLSNRVWNYSQQFRGELELGIDTALIEGTSASKLATRLKQYLNNPDDLFRRVRNNRGNLVLSRHAQAYHPGQGVYRSAYRNAERLARTEINTAYRTADFERYQQLPFVIGIRVQRSNNTNTTCDVCPSLVGAYPKEFKFTGWHPACRCYTTTILATQSELTELTRSLMVGNGVSGFQSTRQVQGVPKNYTDWIERNRERLQRAKALPGFIADNPAYAAGL